MVQHVLQCYVLGHVCKGAVATAAAVTATPVGTFMSVSSVIGTNTVLTSFLSPTWVFKKLRVGNFSVANGQWKENL